MTNDTYRKTPPVSSTHITQAVTSLQLREQELALEIEQCRKTLESLLAEQRLIAKSLHPLLDDGGSATRADGRCRITDQEVGAIARELLNNGPPMQQEQLKAALLARIKAQGRVATGVPLYLARVLRNKAQFTLTADGYSLAEDSKTSRESA